MLYSNKNEYFASANTTNGFISYFNNIFDPKALNKIYIIKGGPGTGKSKMIKSVGEYAESIGLKVEYFRCSSDPDSYDGILINDKKIAILDGTAPHLIEAKFPGAVEKIVYTGSCWNEKLLIANKHNIIDLISKKSSCYTRAYEMLGSYHSFIKAIFSMTMQNYNYEKENKSVESIAKKYFATNSKYSYMIRLTESINKKGIYKLNTFQNNSINIISIQDKNYSAYHYMESLYNKCIKENQEIYISYSNIFPDKINSIYIPSTKSCFIIRKKDEIIEDKEKNYAYINMDRFISKEAIKENKNKITFYKKCSDEIFKASIDEFKNASMYHEMLENYYIKSMDFSKLGTIIQEIIREIQK